MFLKAHIPIPHRQRHSKLANTLKLARHSEPLKSSQTSHGGENRYCFPRDYYLLSMRPGREALFVSLL